MILPDIVHFVVNWMVLTASKLRGFVRFIFPLHDILYHMSSYHLILRYMYLLFEVLLMTIMMFVIGDTFVSFK